MPAVSVVMPVRDAADTVTSAVDSILDQDFEDLELIAVDDGSRDGTAGRLRAVADPRLRTLHFQQPQGLVPALNRGLDEARAPLVARMDGDDLSLPGRIGQQVELMRRHPDVGVCDVLVEIFRDDGPPGGGYLAYQRWLDSIHTHRDFEREFLVENPVVHPASMARASLLRQVGGYRDGPFPEDYDIWLRCLRAGARFHKLQQRLVRWRDHGNRATRTDPRYARTAFFTLKWEHLCATRLASGPRVAVWGAGPTARPWLRSLKRRDLLSGVLDIDPVKIGRTRQDVPIVHPDDLESVPFDLLLIAVGARGARELIRARLAGTSLREVDDFLFVA